MERVVCLFDVEKRDYTYIRFKISIFTAKLLKIWIILISHKTMCRYDAITQFDAL